MLSIKEIIVREFERNNLMHNKDIIEIFDLYANLLISENKKYNLTSITNYNDIVDKHFIDSIIGFEKYKELNFNTNSMTIMDIGTGAGFPGLPILIYNQFLYKGKTTINLHLLDSNKKKTEFLLLIVSYIKKYLDEKSITIHNNRLEELILKDKKPDLFLSRATGNLNQVIKFLDIFLLKNNFINKKSYLLYYGGRNHKIYSDENYQKTNSSSKKIFSITSKIIADFEFSIKKYRRKNILYIFNPRI